MMKIEGHGHGKYGLSASAAVHVKQCSMIERCGQAARYLCVQLLWKLKDHRVVMCGLYSVLMQCSNTRRCSIMSAVKAMLIITQAVIDGAGPAAAPIVFGHSHQQALLPTLTARPSAS